MEQNKRPGHSDSYLLRIWRGGDENQWRWMLQNIRTGEQRGFRDMSALVQFLDAEYGTVKGRMGIENGWGALDDA